MHVRKLKYCKCVYAQIFVKLDNIKNTFFLDIDNGRSNLFENVLKVIP